MPTMTLEIEVLIILLVEINSMILHHLKKRKKKMMKVLNLNVNLNVPAARVKSLLKDNQNYQRKVETVKLRIIKS